MATILLPGQSAAGDPVSPMFESVQPTLETSSRLHMSPINFTQQVFDYGEDLKVCRFTLPRLNATEAGLWVSALRNLKGVVNVFGVDLSEIYLDGVDLTYMRLLTPTFQWDVFSAMQYSLTFTGLEAK